MDYHLFRSACVISFQAFIDRTGSRSKTISRGKTEMSNADKSFRGNAERQAGARVALSMLRIVLGALFINVFFENLNKGLYSATGYAGLITYYMEKGHAPHLLQSVMS